MKKKLLLKVFLFTVIATLVTFTSCKDYDDDISNLEGQISALKSELPAKIDAVKAELGPIMDAKIAVVNGEITSLKTKLTGLEKDLAALTKELGTKASQADLDALNAKIDAVKTEILEKTVSLEVFQAYKTQAEKDLAELREEFVALETRLATAETELGTKASQADLDELKEAIAAYKLVVAGELEELQLTLGALDVRVLALEAALPVLKQELMDALGLAVTALEGKIAALKAELAPRIDVLEGILKVKDGESEVIADIYDKLGKQLDRIIANEGDIKDLQDDLKAKYDELVLVDIELQKQITENLRLIGVNSGHIADNKTNIGLNKDAIDKINLYITTSLEPRLDAIEADIEVLHGKFDKLADEVDVLKAQLETLLGTTNKLLRSLVLIPHHYVNGIEAIGFNSLAYICGGDYWGNWSQSESARLYGHMYQWYMNGSESPVSTSAAKEGDILKANPKSVLVKYYVNPSSITKDMIDVDKLSFAYKLQEHKVRSADINAKAEFVSLTDGILTVRIDLDANKAEMSGFLYNAIHGVTSGKETMDMLALQVPLSEKAKLGETDYDAVVTSDWARVDVEDLAFPVIDRLGTECDVKPVKDADEWTYSEDYPTVAAAKGMTVEDNTPYILELVYDQKYDLANFVTSTALTMGDCGKFDPAEYGLVWNFDLLDENGDVIEYLLESNKTEQQEFINLLDNKKGTVEAKVYDAAPGAGVTDAIGRTPIVRMQLLDPATGCVVTQGFVKIKWVKEQPVFDAEYPTENVDFTCEVNDTIGASRMGLSIKTKWMNTNVMNAMGTYYKEFIKKYTLDTSGVYDANGKLLKGVDAGVVVSNLDDSTTEPEVTDLFSVYLKDICSVNKMKSYTGYVHYTDYVTGEVAIKIKITMNIVMPELGIYGHLGTYWKDSYKQFTLNPLNYGSTADPLPNPTASYKTNLLNGFNDGNGNIPQSAAAAVKAVLNDTYETECAKFEFDPVAIKDYSYTIDGDVYSIAKGNLHLTDDNTNLRFNTVTGPMAATIRVSGTKTYIAVNESGQEGNNWAIDGSLPGSWPTKYSRALIGNEVPVRLVAELCCETECLDPVVVKQYRVKFIKPLEMNAGLAKNFVDAENTGSKISIGAAVTFKDWNNKTVANTNGEAKELYRYYEVLNPVWDLDGIKSNLKEDADGNIVPTVGVTNGNIPLDGADPIYRVVQNGNDLVFYNNGSTIDPTLPELTLYIPVSVKYKWGTETKMVSVKVLPAAGNQ